jgi:hypothetical protein
MQTTFKDLWASDDGYGDTNTARFAIQDGELIIDCERRPSFLTYGLTPSLQGAVCMDIDSNGESGQFTAAKQLMGRDSRINIFNDAYPGGPYNAALISAALSEHGCPSDGIQIATGLPVQNFYDLNSSEMGLPVNKQVERKKASLATHSVSVHGSNTGGARLYSFPAESHTVVSEAAGVLINVLMDDQGNRQNDWLFEGIEDGYVITIDMGSRTTDVCGLSQDMTPIRHRMKTITVGLNDVHADFKAALLQDSELCHRAALNENNLSDDKVRDLFSKGYVMTVRDKARAKVSIADKAEQAFRGIVQHKIIPQLTNLEDDLASIAGIILAGGGAAIGGYMQQAFRAALELDMDIVNDNQAALQRGEGIESDAEQGRSVLCAPRPEYANVRGFLKYLAFIKLGLVVNSETLAGLPVLQADEVA